MSLKAKVESVLFLSDKPLRAQAIAGILGEEVQAVRQALLELLHEFEERGGGLEIADEDGYLFRVKEEYANLMDEFLPMEMSAAELRTLSAIAIKQPIPQSEIIRIRGAGAYDHIKELAAKGLISRKEEGRSPMLSTTKRFQEYFRLSKDGKSLRQYLRKELKKKDREDQQSDLQDFSPPSEPAQAQDQLMSMSGDARLADSPGAPPGVTASASPSDMEASAPVRETLEVPGPPVASDVSGAQETLGNEVAVSADPYSSDSLASVAVALDAGFPDAIEAHLVSSLESFSSEASERRADASADSVGDAAQDGSTTSSGLES